MSNKIASKWTADGRAYVRVSQKVAALMKGEADLSDWDEEEILRGHPKAKDGTFRGQPPSLVPRELYVEFSRRQMEKGFADLIGALPDLIQVLTTIAMNPEEDSTVRVKAANDALDRILGKARERMDIDIQGAVQHERVEPLQFVVNERELWGDADVVDAEIVEGDDDDWTF